MTPIPTASLRGLHAYLYIIQLRKGLSSSQRKAYFHAMNRRLHRAGMLMARVSGICMVVPLRTKAREMDRCIVVDWLIDQQETREVTIRAPELVSEFLTKDFLIVEEEAESGTLSLVEQAQCRHMVRQILGYVLNQILALQSKRLSRS